MDRARLPEVVAAGLRRICLIRGLSTATDPEAEAWSLKAMLS